MKNFKTLILIATLCVASFAKASNGTRGGGTFTAASFIALAREIKVQLTMSVAWEKLGVLASEYEQAVASTNVLCASADKLSFLTANKYDAFFEPADNTIYLNCPTWDSKVTPAMKVTLFHEYMRLLGKEGANYSISSKVQSYLPKESGKVTGLDLSQAIYRGDIKAIYEIVQSGVDMKYESFVCDLVANSSSGRVTSIINGDESVRIDSESGLYYPREVMVSLIKYLTSMGADPNQTCFSNGETALFRTYDPVMMEALLKVGANPARKSLKGEEPLYIFLLGYQNYPNKAYFRLVVKYMLDLGASPKSCLSDNSACVDTKFASDDDELAKLLRSYMH